MSTQSLNPRTAALVAIVLSVALLRLVQIAPNVSPVAALALFAGAHFADRRLALLLPLAAMLLSDLVLGLHATLPFVYLAFAINVLLGRWLGRHPGAVNTLAAATAGSLLFFLVTNFGVWLTWDFYPPTLAGLGEAYLAGLPFYRNTLVGDLFFTALLFGGFALAERRWAGLRAGRGPATPA